MEKFKKLHEAELKNLDALAQTVWGTKDLEQKRAALITMINSMKGKPAIAKYTAQAQKITRADKLDVLASNLMLSDKDKLV